MKQRKPFLQRLGQALTACFALLLFGGLASLMPIIATKAQSAPSYTATWVNRSTINLTDSAGTQIVLKDNDWDSNWQYTGTVDNNCSVKIDGFGKDQSVGFTDAAGHPGINKGSGQWDANASQAKLTIERNTTGTSCIDQPGYTKKNPKTISIGDYQNAQKAFVWADSGTITRLNNPSDWTFTAPAPQSDGTTWFYRQSEANDKTCKDIVRVSSDKASIALFEQGDGSGGTVSPIDSGCHLIYTANNLRNGSAEPDSWNSAIPSDVMMPLDNTGSDLPAGSVEATASQNSKAKSCSVALASPITWILCPLINIATSAAQKFDEALNKVLQNNAGQFNEVEKQSGQQLFSAWSVMRNIALMIFVIVMLVVVISQAIGIGPFDAYTIRKLLPRILIAAILTTLSWFLCKMFINFTNDLGQGIKGLLYAPFGGAANVESSIHAGGSVIAGTLVNGGLAYGGLLLIGIADLGIILTTAMLVLGAVMIGFTVIIARNIAIVALVIFSPIAAVLYILPNTKKYADLWWDAFSRGLLMYPMIIGLIALGRVFAYITIYGGKPYTGDIPLQNHAGDLITLFIALVAFFGPYFLIPKTFALAGGLVSRIAGVANDRSKGFFDRNRKKREERIHALRERSNTMNRFGGKTRLSRFGNTLASIGVDPMSNYRIYAGTSKHFSRLPGGERGRALLSELTQKSALQSQDLAKWMSQAGFNQEALTAIMQNAQGNNGRVNEAQLHSRAHEWMTKDIGSKDADGVTITTQHRAAAKQMESYAPFLTDLWRTEEFGRANAVMAAGLAKGSQGFLNSEDPEELAKLSNYLNSERPGLGDTFKTTAGLMNAQAGGVTKVGYSEQVDKDGNYTYGGVGARSILLMRQSVQDIAGAKSSQLKGRYMNKDDRSKDAIFQIMSADTSNGNIVEIIDDHTGETAKIDSFKQSAVLDNLLQAAYGYNTPAETAAALKDELKALEDASGPAMRQQIEQARQRITREGMDPAKQAQFGQQPQQQDPFDRGQ